jgi:hypothetical protein
MPGKKKETSQYLIEPKDRIALEAALVLLVLRSWTGTEALSLDKYLTTEQLSISIDFPDLQYPSWPEITIAVSLSLNLVAVGIKVVSPMIPRSAKDAFYLTVGGSRSALP